MSHDPTPIEGYDASPQQERHARDRSEGLVLDDNVDLCLYAPSRWSTQQLQAALHEVAEHHESLRTRMVRVPGLRAPVQVIDTRTAIGWNAVRTEAASHAIHVACEPASGGHRLHLRLAGYALDSASCAELVQQWSQRLAGQPLSDDVVQYPDYAQWRNDAIDAAAAAAEFWRQQLSIYQAPARLPLRGAHGRFPVRLDDVPVELPSTLESLWRGASTQWGVSPADCLLAAVIALFAQHAQADSLSLGLEWQTRSSPLVGALGLFSEALPFTVEIDSRGLRELSALVSQERAATLDLRDAFPSAQPKQPAALGFCYVPAPRPVDVDAALELEWVRGPAAPFQWRVECHEPADGLAPPRIRLSYNTALYGQRAAQLLADQFVQLFAAALAEPERPLRSLSALSATARQHIEDHWSRAPALAQQPAARYEAIATLPNLSVALERSLRDHPERIAVRAAGATLRYAELDRQSAVLACELQARGAGPGTRVAHVLPRHPDAVIALLAIVRAGATYVPIDPASPSARIEAVLNDSEAALVLTHAASAPALPEHYRDEARTLLLDTLSQQSALAAQPAPCAARAADPAYIIYTSGSTGAPKGVPITHAGALHSLAARVAYYDTKLGGFLLLSSFAFDSSLAGLCWTLCEGGTLHLTSDADQRDPEALARMLAEEEITHLLALPSLYGLLLQSPAAAPAALRVAIVAGESCPPSLLSQHHRVFPGARLYNEYGPTEAAVWSTVAECGPQAVHDSVPIGRPIPHNRVLLLSPEGELVAAGLRGELYIESPGLSPGYLQRPQETAERFVAVGDSRRYRTGDHGYWNEDGELVFLGRSDAQVKIRGHRVELGEIEAALQRHSGQSRVVVLPVSVEGSHMELRAFIEAPPDLDLDRVRTDLATELPAYMLPASLESLPALPETTHGKLDRNALLSRAPRRTRAPYRAPSSHEERLLATVFGELLGLAAVGRDDDFFALGGHSLLAVRLVHAVQARCDVTLPVSAIFAHRTVAALGAALHDARSGGDHHGLLRLRAGSSDRTPLFVLPTAGGRADVYAPLLDRLDAAQPVYAPLLPTAAPPTLQAQAAALLAAVEAAHGGPYLLCGWSIGGVLAFELCRQLEQRGKRVALLAMIDSTFDPSDEPLAASELLQILNAELSPEARAKLGAVPSAQLDAALQALAPARRHAQLRGLLLDFSAQHALPLSAPRELVAARLDEMQAAALWLRGYIPDPVTTPATMFFASDSVRERPGLPASWASRVPAASTTTIVSTEHDEILAHPELAAALAQQLGPTTGASK